VVPNGCPTFYQLYVNKDQAVTEELITEVASLKPRGIMVIADLLLVGKRGVDERAKAKATSTTDWMQQAQILRRDFA